MPASGAAADSVLPTSARRYPANHSSRAPAISASAKLASVPFRLEPRCRTRSCVDVPGPSGIPAVKALST
jgi:hypothetical protein